MHGTKEYMILQAGRVQRKKAQETGTRTILPVLVTQGRQAQGE